MKSASLLGVVAAVLFGGYLMYVLSFTVDSDDGMEGIVMDGGPAMNMASDTGGSSEGFQNAINIMMEGIMRPATGYPDVDFVRMMISHHEGTFAMAALEMQFGRDKIAQALADNAITSQKKELTFLKDWLGQQDLSIMKIVPQANQANYASMLSMMKGMSFNFTGNTDVDFANVMIPHHEGAIDMAKVVLQFGTDAEIRKFAEKMIATKKNEIALLRDWLAKATP